MPAYLGSLSLKTQSAVPTASIFPSVQSSLLLATASCCTPLARDEHAPVSCILSGITVNETSCYRFCAVASFSHALLTLRRSRSAIGAERLILPRSRLRHLMRPLRSSPLSISLKVQCSGWMSSEKLTIRCRFSHGPDRPQAG